MIDLFMSKAYLADLAVWAVWKDEISFHVFVLYKACPGQIIATSHDRKPQKVAKEGKSPYFREISVGELL